MALLRNEMQRSFTFKKGTEMITLPDPNPNDSPESVMSYYSNIYPELTTATVSARPSRMTGLYMSSRQPSEQKDENYE